MADDDNSKAKGKRKALPKLTLDHLKSPLGDVIDPLKGYKLPDASLKILDDMKEMQKRLRDVSGIGNPMSAAVREQLGRQSSLIHDLHTPQPRLERMEKNLREVHIPRNPILDTNVHLEEISQRFDQMLEVMASASAVATQIQSDANTFLEKFDEASEKTDKAARTAIRVSIFAVALTVLTGLAPLIISIFSRDTTAGAIENLTREIVAEQKVEAAATAKMIEELRQGDQAVADRLAEELRQTREENATLLRELQNQVARPD